MIFKRSLHFTPACHLTEAAEAAVAGAAVAAARGSGVKAGRASQASAVLSALSAVYYLRSYINGVAYRCCCAAEL